MTHEERVALAEEVAWRIRAKHGANILAIAVYGSVAKNEDGPDSDLELWVATQEPVQPDEQVFVYRGLSVEISYSTGQRMLASVREVGSSWAIQADPQRSYHLLFDRDGFAQQLTAAVAEPLPDAAFREAMREGMCWLNEGAGKLRNAWERGARYDLLSGASRYFVWNVAMLIGLANRRYYPSGRGLYELSKQMPLQPARYAELLDAAGGFSTADPVEVYTAALALWDSVQAFVRGLGIEWVTVELPL